MNFEEARVRFDVPELAAAIPAVPAGNGHNAVPAVPAVTLLAVRNMALPALTPEDAVIARDFGCCSNVVLAGKVFRAEPVYKQLVMYNCQHGVFNRKADHPNVLKMLQLVSLARLGRKNALPNIGAARAAAYQAIALAESMGVFLPNEWKVTREESHLAIIQAVQWLLGPEGEERTGLMLNDWYTAEIVGIPLAVVANRGPFDIGQALVILEAMAVGLPSNATWLNSLSYMVTAISSICRRGTMNNDQITKVTDGVKAVILGQNVNIPPATVERFYRLYGTGVNETNAERVLEHFKTLVPEDVIVLRNVILQAAGSGLTTYMTILRAFQAFPDFNWPLASVYIPADFRNFQVAIAAVGGNVYFGFGHQMVAASAKKFPSLAYCAFYLCSKVGGDAQILKYGGIPKVVPGKLQLDRILTAYAEARVAQVEGNAAPAAVTAATNEIVAAGVAAYAVMQGAPPPAADP